MTNPRPLATIVTSAVELTVDKATRRRRDFANENPLVETGVARLFHVTILAVLAALVGFIVWASLTEVQEMAVTFGEVVPAGPMQQVQHLEGGIVAEILVTDGELVDAGQPLVRLDAAAVLAERLQLRGRLAALDIQTERLTAFAGGRRPDFSRFAGFPTLVDDQNRLYDAQVEAREAQHAIFAQQIVERRSEITGYRRGIESAQESLDLIGEEVRIREGLFDKALNSKLILLDAKRRRADVKADLKRLEDAAAGATEAITQFEARRTELDGRLRQEALDKLSVVRAEWAEVEQIIAGLEDRIGRLIVVAPTRGVIQNLAVKTVRGVIPPGGVVADIVPVDKSLIVEARVSTRDIGFVSAGQPVKVKVHTFDFSRYGSIPGTMQALSATTFLDEQKVPYYKAKVSLERNHVGSEPGHHLILPGMTVEADINTGRKTILQYLLKPIYTNLRESFRER